MYHRRNCVGILTPKQLEVVQLLVEDKSPKEAAAILKLPNGNAAEQRLRQARRALGVHTTYGLIARFLRSQLALLFLLSTLQAADYPVLVNTNMASNFGNLIVWRSFIEPEEMHLLATNWSDTVKMPIGTNGAVAVYQVANVVTNHFLKFTFEGSHYTNLIAQERGPVVGMREIPTPLSIPALQLRNRR